MRHGRTAWNAEGRFQGRSDVALDDVGRAQAAALGRALQSERFDAAIASDLVRARATAELILRARAAEPALRTDARWREFDFGAWEGLTWAQIAARFPEAEGRPNAGGRFVSPAGSSETFDDVVRRVEAALASIRAEPAFEKVLVVTHAGPLHALLRLSSGSESEALQMRFLPASINRFRLERGRVFVVRTNEVASDLP